MITGIKDFISYLYTPEAILFGMLLGIILFFSVVVIIRFLEYFCGW